MQNESDDRLPLSSNGREMASRLQSIRDILTSDRDSGLSADEHRAALDVVDNEIAEREETTYDNTLHNRLGDNAVNDRYSYLLERNGSTSPSSIARSRRRQNRPLDRIQRQTDRMHRLASRSDSSEQPPSNHSQLSPLISSSSRTRQASDEQESDMDPHQSRDGKPVRKRRKLDDGTPDHIRLFPEYGLEGTLLPGTLNMIVLDIQGTSDAQSPVDETAKVKLPLPDNQYPYRTKRNHCDILMKHSGGLPFALSKLIVKIPHRDYDAPPLQGMVFVSMNRESLLSQASHYNTYFPVSHGHHRRRYDSYRPSVDYMRSARSPRPAYRPRRPSDHLPQEMPWYDSRLSLSDPAEIPTHPSIKISLEPVLDPEETLTYGPRSPRPWEQDNTYSQRPYLDRYRPSASSRPRERDMAGTQIPTLPSTSSEDEEDSQDQDHSQSNPDDPDDLYDHNIPTQQRDYEESEARRRNILEQMRLRRTRGDEYSHTPSYPRPTSHGDDEDAYSPEQIAAIEATLTRRGHDIDALRRRSRLGPPTTTNVNATGANTQSPRPVSPPPHPLSQSYPHPPFHSTKRLPGCTGMLQGQTPHSPSDCASVVPHATFRVARESGGGIAVNFAPEVSGIYILVKLWAICPNSNVSVQNIVPVGYGTVRQVADIEFR